MFIEETFEHRREDAYEAATATFLHLLEAQKTLSPAEQDVLHRHVARFAALLPRPVLAQNFTSLDADGEITSLVGRLHKNWRLKPGAGPRLAGWWRSQDPLPATILNERLEEHLQRAAYADSAYADPHSLTGWDDRGLIYVRLGAPSLKRSINFDTNCLVEAVINNERIFSGDFPENEVWRYGSAKNPALFVFTAFQGPYKLVTPAELLPNHLVTAAARDKKVMQGPVTAQVETRDGALCGYWMGAGSPRQVLVLALERIYESLIPLDGQFMGAYTDVVLYINHPRDEAPVPGSVMKPEIWARSFLANQSADEQRELLRREKRVSRQQSEVLTKRFMLPILARTARFLEADGTTSTDVYWTFPAEALARSEWVNTLLGEGRLSAHDRYLIHTTLVGQTSDYRPDTVQVRRLIVRTSEATEAGVAIPIQRLVLPQNPAAFYHLAIQWDAYPLQGEGDATTLSAKKPVARGVFRADSLSALDARPDRLEMSDLVPITMESAQRFDAARPSREAITPYFGAPKPNQPIGLYFEVYHLLFEQNDQTHYTVEYEIARKEERGWLGLFKGKEDDPTAVSLSYEGTMRTAKEVILLDLETWNGKDALRITVRITDEVSGQTVERTLHFSVPDASS